MHKDTFAGNLHSWKLIDGVINLNEREVVNEKRTKDLDLPNCVDGDFGRKCVSHRHLSCKWRLKIEVDTLSHIKILETKWRTWRSCLNLSLRLQQADDVMMWTWASVSGTFSCNIFSAKAPCQKKTESIAILLILSVRAAGSEIESSMTTISTSLCQFRVASTCKTRVASWMKIMVASKVIITVRIRETSWKTCCTCNDVCTRPIKGSTGPDEKGLVSTTLLLSSR